MNTSGLNPIKTYVVTGPDWFTLNKDVHRWVMEDANKRTMHVSDRAAAMLLNEARQAGRIIVERQQPGVYQCAECGAVYVKARTDAEADAEYREKFPDVEPDAPTRIVCEECWQEQMKAMGNNPT